MQVTMCSRLVGGKARGSMQLTLMKGQGKGFTSSTSAGRNPEVDSRNDFSENQWGREKTRKKGDKGDQIGKTRSPLIKKNFEGGREMRTSES